MGTMILKLSSHTGLFMVLFQCLLNRGLDVGFSEFGQEIFCEDLSRELNLSAEIFAAQNCL